MLRRRAPTAMLRLLGKIVPEQLIWHEDVSVALPEFRADQVMMVKDSSGKLRWGVHFEFQTRPDQSVLVDWCFKNAALNKQLRVPVYLVALYLERSDRATFPDHHTHQEDALRSSWLFNAVRLWEHASAIRSGELPELAPLLILCEDSPSGETIRQELELIRAAPLAPDLRRDLLAVAYTIGTRYFLRGVLNALFSEELPMIKDAGIISDWLEEARAKAIVEGLEQGLEQGREQGREQGLERGLVEGRTTEARRLALRLLKVRFGELPSPWTNRIEQFTAEQCEALIDRAARAESLMELSVDSWEC